MFTRFKSECTALYAKALSEAKRLQHSHVGVEHVALALLSDPVYPLVGALRQFGFDASALMRVFEKEVGTGKSPSNTPEATPRLTAILALGAAQGELTARAILRSILLEGESLFARFLVAQGVAPKKLLDVLDGGESNDSSADATRFSGGSATPTSTAPAKPASSNTPPSYHANAGAKIEPKSAIPVTFPTSLRGQFEERITQIVREATDAPDVILFIDEIHTIVGAGGEGAQDAAQILKPALARGDVDCIGATTQDEFNHFIRKDPALERRFSPVLIGELSGDATLRVLQVVAPRIAAKHSANGFTLEFDAESLKVAVNLTNRYVKDRQQPDKAIDAIDIAAARAVIGGRNRVTTDDVAAVVSEWTGIQVQRMSEDDRSRFNRMEQVLGAKVVGQDAAVKALSQRVRAAMAGVKAGNRPVGVFLFLGPSGVGKTSLAKELAHFLFDSSDALLRFDMGEYHEAHTVANLIGAPVGYKESEQGGALSEGLRRQPSSVVLLDEIEKAHPDVMNVFLSVFDEGRITDNRGRLIDCSNAIFVLTSNIGSGEVDFRTAGADELRTLAERFMRRELVNRISGVIGFQPLGSDQMAKILDQIIAEKSRMFETEKGMKIEVDPFAKIVMLDRGYSPDLGARPLERAVDELIVQPLVDAWFGNRLRTGTVRFTASDSNTITFSQD